VGDYDFSKREDIDKFFTDFTDTLGMDKFTLLHLNDSKTPLKSRVDRHESLGEGYIWNGKMECLKYLLDKCKTFEIPAILETTITDLYTVSTF
jgi:deoxyribonuclease-4